MSKFNLDPRAAPPPPAPPVVVPRPQAPPPPPAPAVAAEPARGRRKMLLVGAAVVALLLVGGAVAVYAMTSLGYPDKYLLDGGERPAGYTNARLSADEMESMGIERNPGEVSGDVIEEREHDLGREEGHAKEAHMQVLSSGNGARVIVLAARYQNEDEARDAANDLRFVCSVGVASVLRDGDVVVTVLRDQGATATHVRAVVGALQSQNGDLARVCG